MPPEKTLSIFVDESGDFGAPSEHSPYYIFTLVFHDQSDDISENISRLNERLAFDGYANHAIHTGPLIRREKDYENMGIGERKTLFKRIYYFARKTPVKYRSFVFTKREYHEQFALVARMSQDLSAFVDCNRSFFASFDRFIMYYDNGQHELNQMLITVLNAVLHNVDFRRAMQTDYRLSQVADLICTLELLRIKMVSNVLSASEKHFFDRKELKKTYLSGIESLRFDECKIKHNLYYSDLQEH